MKRILYIAPGNSIHSKKWIDYFADVGDLEVTWISFDGFSYDRNGNVVEVSIPRAEFAFVYGFFKFFNEVRKADIVHVHSLGFYALISLFAFNKKIVSTAWGSDIVFAKSNIIKKFVVSSILKLSNLITCDAKHMVNRIVAYGVNPEVVKVINFGIDTNKFIPAENQESSNNKYIISTRNFEKVYDVETVIRTYSELYKIEPDIDLVLVGSGSQEDYLKALVIKLGVEKSVRFTGRISQSDIIQLLQNATVYVSSSLSDGGIAASTAEAMACGTVCVLSDIGDNADWIEEGVSGFLFPPSDCSVLLDKLVKVVENQDEFHSVALKGREVIVMNNDYHNEMKKMHDLYKLHLD